MAFFGFHAGSTRLRVAAFWALVIALSAAPLQAQKGGGSSSSGSKGNTGGGVPARSAGPIMEPGMQPNYPAIDEMPPVTTTQPQQKQVAIEDESCLPWELPDARGATVSAIQLAVPGNARSQYEKACSAFKKLKLSEAEQHARDAIEKYSKYSAAWVMLGQALQGQNKMEEAHEACSQPIHADPTYLPPYLCLAGLLNVEKKWSDLVTWSDRFSGMNLTGDMYAYYYRGLAQFHLQDFPAAQKSFLKAIEIDSAHNQPAFNFLLAQDYVAQGDLADATLQMQQYLKFAKTRQEKEAGKEFLAHLQSQQSAN
jgi:tetratricopeptide (TPR) repeat protein